MLNNGYAHKLKPMNVFRRSLLRRWIIAVFLLTGLVAHAQTVFACNLMGGTPKAVCCCTQPMVDHCTDNDGCATSPPMQDVHHNPCCQTSFNQPAGLTSVAPVPADSQTDWLVQALHAPPALIAAPHVDAFPSTVLSSVYPATYPTRYTTNNLYLLTRRLRI